MPLERDEFIAQYRERLEAQRDDEMIRMDPTGDFAKRYYNEQRKLAILSAIVNDRPEWFNRMDPKTGEPRTYSVTRDWQTGALRFSEVTGSFGDTAPYSAFGGGRQVAQEPMHTYMFGTVLTGLTEEGMDTDLSNPDVQQMILQRSIEIGIPGETAIEFIENMRKGGGPPPKIDDEPGGPTPQITENIYGPDSYEPDGDPILDDPSGTIKWRVQEGRHFHEISNDDMIKREIRITTGLIKEGQSELSDITRQIDGLGDTYPERQRKMELGLEQKSKQESLEALKNRLKAIPSYFGTAQNQQNPISPGGFSPIGSIGLFPK